MTAPLQEPTTDRALQGFAYQRDQIFRRPAPPSEGLLIGEMYKESTQTISSGAFTKLTSWDQWNVPFPDTIDQGTNALTIGADGYYMLEASCFWATQPVNGELVVEVSPNPYGFTEDRDEIHSQAIESRFVNRMMTFLWLPLNASIQVYVEHQTGSNRNIQLATLRIASLPINAGPPFYV